MWRKRSKAQQEEASQDTALFKLLAVSLTPYRWWLILAMVLMLGVASLNVVPPYLLQQAIDGPIQDGNTRVLWQLAAIYGVTALALFVLTLFYTFALQQAGQRALADLRSRLFNHIFKQDHAFMTNTPTGDLISRLTSDIDSVNAVLSSSIVVILVEGVTLIAIMLLGHWVEMRSVKGASRALEELVRLLPDTALRMDSQGNTQEVSVSELQRGDRVLLRPGAKVPVDGEIVEGESLFNEAMLTGESKPVSKKAGDVVIGGAINGAGAVTGKPRPAGRAPRTSRTAPQAG